MNSNCETLIRQFRDPSGEYMPLLMWFWNDYITEDEITFQMEKMREQNIINFFIHPTGGMLIEYLSDRYMELIQYVVKEAKRLDMHYWIYDEYEFPSGSAGGTLCVKYPEHRQKYLGVEERFMEMPAARVNICKQGTFVGAQLVWEKDGKNFVRDISDECEVHTVDGVTTLTYQYRENNCSGRAFFYFCEVNLAVRVSGNYRIGADAIPGYVDMISREAVGKFIELTHERYKQFIGDEFGKTVPGIFTDEPSSFSILAFCGFGPWNDAFPAEFEKDHGYSILPWLYALWSVEAKSPKEIQVQQDYRNTVKRLYFDAFMGQIAHWCRDNNLIFTGHIGGEENLFHHLAQCDSLEELTMMDIPGCDSILASDRIDTPEFNIAGKLAAAAAKYNGSDRVLCETFSGSGWKMRFPLMKRILNRLLVMGANWIQYMGGFYTIGAAAKNFPFGFPPSHNYNNTLFKHYHDLNKYIAGFQSLSVNTKPDSNVLLFFPLHQTLQERHISIRERWNQFDTFENIQNIAFIDTVNALLYEGVSYDFYSEHMTDAITVHDGWVEAFGYRYDTLIFPRMKFINGKTRKLIEKLKAHNVKMIFTWYLPSVDTDNGETFDPGFRMEICDAAARVQRDGNVWFIDRKEGDSLELLRSAFRSLIPDRILHMEADKGVYICKRSNEDTEVYFLCNDNREAARAAVDALPGMRILDPDTGEEADYRVKDGKIHLTLGSYEMLAMIRDKADTTVLQSTPAPLPETGMQVLEAPYVFTAEDGNFLPLHYEMYDTDLQKWVACRYMRFLDGLHMRPEEPYRLRAWVQIDKMPGQLFLNAEVMRVTRLAVNGKEIPFCVNTKRWCPYDFTLDATELFHEGENLIELDAVSESIVKFSRPQFLHLSGDFTVTDEGHIAAPVAEIPAIGWEKAGYPYYIGDGIYKVCVSVEAGWKKAVLTIPTDDIAMVFVNGQFVGKKLWLKNDMDVSDFLKPGSNEIEVRITSTCANLFGCEADGFEESIFYGHYSAERTNNGLTAPMELHFYG